MTIVLTGLQLRIGGGNSVFNLRPAFNYLGSADTGKLNARCQRRASARADSKGIWPMTEVGQLG